MLSGGMRLSIILTTRLSASDLEMILHEASRSVNFRLREVLTFLKDLGPNLAATVVTTGSLAIITMGLRVCISPSKGTGHSKIGSYPLDV
jgi:hypothetical protein